MCGIVGIFNHRNSAPVEPSVIRRMTDVIAHRGPDDEGIFTDNNLGLGHRRLSIIDLSARGKQPMVSPDGRFVITYNGEVYNYVELRRELMAHGHSFKTETDTEVVLTLYATLGPKCLERLNGMFAFAIWDTREHKLFLTRDRVGIKPLYYAETSAGIVFASEIKALLASGQINANVALEQIDPFMRFGYVPGSETLFRGVRKLLPGHWLRLDEYGFDMHKYWDIDYEPDYNRGAEKTAEELRALLQDAAHIRMRSDVPVGVFLSGGLDSSTTVALLREAGVSDLKTFSVAYDRGPDFDESQYARLVADHFGTEHHSLYIEPTDFADFIPKFVWYMDEPVAEAAAISLYFIARLLREHVVVALSGEGADELFAGYDIYRYMRWLERYRKLPETLREHVTDPLGMTLGGDKMKKYIRLAANPLEDRYVGVSLPEPWYREFLYTDEFKETLGRNGAFDPLQEHYARTAHCDILHKMLYADLKSWLVDDLLLKADKMTMANSVELRVPFLDYRVVEYAATIPADMKMRGSNVKWILKQAMQKRLPDKILSRSKVGFPTPLALMFKENLADYLRDFLLSESSLNRHYFKAHAVEQIIQEHVTKQRDHHQVLWQLMVLDEWHRLFQGKSWVSYCNETQHMQRGVGHSVS